jgi:hypothetical protein
MKLIKISRVMPLVVMLSLTGCNDSRDSSHEFYTDFNKSTDGWMHGFSDFEPTLSEGFEFRFGVNTIPVAPDRKGFLLSAQNRSDDLFMFLKTRLTGLTPNERYSLHANVSFYSNGGAGCVGIGGAPGENVYLKVGHSIAEPRQIGYDLNVDKGGQSDSGRNALFIGNVAVDGIGCSGTALGKKSVSTDNQQPLTVETDATGAVWVFIGTDSGFEGLTTLYYETIKLQLTPE